MLSMLKVSTVELLNLRNLNANCRQTAVYAEEVLCFEGHLPTLSPPDLARLRATGPRRLAANLRPTGAPATRRPLKWPDLMPDLPCRSTTLPIMTPVKNPPPGYAFTCRGTRPRRRDDNSIVVDIDFYFEELGLFFIDLAVIIEVAAPHDRCITLHLRDNTSWVK